MMDTLLPGYSRQTGHTQVPVLAAFSLPGGAGHPAAVKVLCSSVYVRHTSRDCWHIGMKFTAFDEGGQALDSYLSSRGVRP